MAAELVQLNVDVIVAWGPESIDLRTRGFAVRTPADVAAALQAAVREGAEAVLVNETSALIGHRTTLGELALKDRLHIPAAVVMRADHVIE